MALPALGVVVFVLAAFPLVFEVLRNFNRWRYEPKLKPKQPPLPPGDLGWPIFGNMFEFLRAFKSGNPQAFIGSYIKRYKRIGVYKAFMFGQPTILATTPEACKLAFMNDDLFVTGWPESTVRLMGRKSFTSVTPEEHKRLRRLTATSLNGLDALRLYLPRIEKYAIEALESWADRDEISYLLELKKFTFNVISDIFVSYKPGPKSSYLEHQYRDINYGIRAMPINLPGTAYHKALKSRVRLVAQLQSAIDERRAEATQEKKHDMLEALMEAVDNNGNYLTDEEIIDVIIMYLNAGHESSAHTLMWMIIFLKQNPRVFDRVMAEQMEIRGAKKPNEPLTIDDCRKMKYLAKVIDETLRLVNISPMVFRKSLHDVEFNGYTIPKGWHVQMWMRQVHLDPEVYSDPAAFNPDRWDNFVLRPATFIPFGAGSRLCPGNDLAKLEMCVFMHYMILNYTVEPVSPNSRIRYLPHPRPVDNYPARVRRVETSHGGGYGAVRCEG